MPLFESQMYIIDFSWLPFEVQNIAFTHLLLYDIFDLLLEETSRILCLSFQALPEFSVNLRLNHSSYAVVSNSDIVHVVERIIHFVDGVVPVDSCSEEETDEDPEADNDQT